MQELEARTRCGSAPGPVEEELERSHLPWQRARGLAGARLGSWEQQPLKPLTLALQAPEPAFSFLFIRKLQRRFLEIYLVFWGCRGQELAFALADQQELRVQWCCSSILWSPRVFPLSREEKAHVLGANVPCSALPVPEAIRQLRNHHPERSPAEVGAAQPRAALALLLLCRRS